ncbi:WD40-repeat-containing domain protein [Dichotomocladium elegans]|nr:WD40-repeat-containing domain protein [Dichotomocladium elegans]
MQMQDSYPQITHRSVKSRIAHYLRRTGIASLTTIAEQIGGSNGNGSSSSRNSSRFPVTSSSLRQQSRPGSSSEYHCTHRSRQKINSSSGFPIDEGFHQSQQKLLPHGATATAIDNNVCKIDLLGQLPVEIALYILLYCDFETVLALSLVSRKWYQLSQDSVLWRNLYLNHPYWPSSARHRKNKKLFQHNNSKVDYRAVYQQRFLLGKRWITGDKRVHTIVAHADSIYCVQFDADKIVTGSRDRTIKMWDMQGRLLRTLNGHYASVLCLQYDQDIMVSGSSDHTILVWDMHSYETIRRMRGHTSGVLDVCFDDKIIASCSKDTTVRIWGRNNGQTIRILQGHRGPVNAIQFRGDRLVSASGDAIIKLWDIQTGQCLRDFNGHTRGLACIRFDGKRIVSGSNDNKIKVWDAGKLSIFIQ